MAAPRVRGREEEPMRVPEPSVVARVEERRQAIGVAEISVECEPVGGGVMSFTAVGSWSNQACDVGMHGPVPEEEIDRLVAFYVSRGVEPRAEVCPYADEGFVRGLAARGFTVREFENVLVRRVAAGEDFRASCAHGWPGGVEIRYVERGDAAMVRRYAEVTSGIFTPGGRAPEHMVALAERCVRHPRSDTFVALAGGEVIGGGSMETGDPYAGERAASLFGGSVVEGWRRRGIQQALIAARLERAAANGATLAVIHTRPGIPTERNAMRLGFAPSYTKVAMAMAGEGLTPSP